jgi:hypothetical protein
MAHTFPGFWGDMSSCRRCRSLYFIGMKHKDPLGSPTREVAFFNPSMSGIEEIADQFVRFRCTPNTGDTVPLQVSEGTRATNSRRIWPVQSTEGSRDWHVGAGALLSTNTSLHGVAMKMSPPGRLVEPLDAPIHPLYIVW